ncbi:hypothetical protein [Paenibacillus sp. NPDC055715]
MDSGLSFKGRYGGGWCLPSLLNSDFFDLKYKGENRNLKATASLVQHHSASSAALCLKLTRMNPTPMLREYKTGS